MVKFSRVKGTDPISTKSGTASPTFIRFWDQFCRGLESLFTQQAQTNTDLQEQIDRLTAFLNGTGEQLTGSDALYTGVVVTRAVGLNAITSEAAAFTSATLALSGAAETTVQTTTYPTSGESLEVRANFFLTIWHPAAGGINATIRIYRDATKIYEQVFVAINGDLLQGWQTPTVIEEPAAGPYTYTVTVQASVATYATAETSSRLLQVREFKR